MNLDITGLRLIVKGVAVRVGGDTKRGVVQKVSRGSCLVLWDGEPFALPYYCRDLEVI